MSESKRGFLTIGTLREELNNYSDDQRVLVALLCDEDIKKNSPQLRIALRTPTKTFEMTHPASGDQIMCLGFEVIPEYFDLPSYDYD